ncbi:hypothetical protein F5Y08DRAFT_350892 [Xylaria arbuscula]|nr:hypothetical protein F5Y08DRAFT_350892 [Xylaria arbuscula]
MRLTISSFLCLSLLKQTAALPSNQARQDVGIQSVNLVFNSQCARQKDITDAWDDAIKIVTDLPQVDFNDGAAIDYFGAPGWNMDYRSKIQAVFDSAKTFGQGWKITPTPFKVQINVDCGADTTRELDERCKGKGVGLKAYTWNTKDVNGNSPKGYNDKSATMNMYVCNSWFAYSSLTDRINEWKNDPDRNKRYNMDYYTNRAYVILHEMMHANRITYEANGNRHIQDMTMHIYEFVPGAGRNYTRKLIPLDAYGSLGTKILARTRRDTIASDITRNARLASKCIKPTRDTQSLKTHNGRYPSLPIANAEAIGDIYPRTGSVVITDGSDWGVDGTNLEEILTDGDDLTFTTSEDITADVGDLNDEEFLGPLTDLEWIADDQYPSDYIQQQKEWASMLDTPTSTATPTPTPTSISTPTPTPTEAAPSGPTTDLQCNGLESKIYMHPDTLVGNIQAFCQTAVAQGVQDKDSGSIFRNYNPGTLDEVDIAIDWPSGVNIPFDEPECNNQLLATSNGCDGNDPANPVNWKGGGTTTITTTNPDLKVLYHITPKAPRQPLPNTPGGSCNTAYKFLYDEFWIGGNGYATADFGQGSGGLLQQLKGCDGLTGWNFNYGLGDDGREWSANGHLLIGKRDCVVRAIASAGGPSDIHCSGSS